MKKVILILMLVVSVYANTLKQNQWYACIASDGVSELYIQVLGKKAVLTDNIKLYYNKKTKAYENKNEFGEHISVTLIMGNNILFSNNYLKPEKWACEKMSEEPVFTFGNN